MKKRITVNQVKAKHVDAEKVISIIDEWRHECYDVLDDDRKMNYIIDQIAGALFMDDIRDKDRISIIAGLVDHIGLTLFTPKAWEFVKENLKKDVNNHCNLMDVFVMKVDENGERKVVKTRKMVV